ncbi:MAG: nucleotide exchange factor GrpE [Lachnospiraceae bacterium]|nr:nucleotide exchange factor GrpE [Lachnospiraceae bacterium]
MIDEELKKSSEEQDTEETTAGKATEQEASTTEEGKDTETKDSDAKDAGETENAEQSATSETSDAETEKLKKKYEDALAEQKDKYIRLYAEFDNYRKRTEKEKAQNFDFGAREVIEKLLPVVDNFERALGTVDPEDEDDAFTKGVRGIYKQLEKMFEDLEVKAIPAEGEKFDPNLHNAVMTDTESDVEEDTITQDLLKGYTYKGQVVRHSMVKVKK